MKDEELKLLIDSLSERAKELNCLYNVEAALQDKQASLKQVFEKLLKIIPPGWQFPSLCKVRITFLDESVQGDDFYLTKNVQSGVLLVDGKSVGKIEVFYSEREAFLSEEQKLLNTIADRISGFIYYKSLLQTAQRFEEARLELSRQKSREWRVILNLLVRTDTELYLRMARKMLNYLYFLDLPQAETLFLTLDEQETADALNKPSHRENLEQLLQNAEQTFGLAGKYINDDDILTCIQKWLQEDRVSFLITALEDLTLPLAEIQNALTRFHHMAHSNYELSEYTEKNLKVLLIHRFFTDQLEFIEIAKNFVEIGDFYQLMKKMIYPNQGHGKLGGKAAGIFLAQSILRNEHDRKLNLMLKQPKTWYISSDTMRRFLQYNNIKEIVEQKYKPVEQVREEYPNLIQIFKNSHFPAEIVKGLQQALDDFGASPIIIRSSSLLEDRIGAAFSGKYKSLFLANQGNPEEKLTALLDAVAEVYASVFGPEPIAYRKEKGLIDFQEEMAVIVQEVVGKRVGKYFLPAFSGVAFSSNEFRWSPRIKREDGLIRLVPGLGTRAVDRLRDDFPILIAPGQPDLRVNVTTEEILHYSPQYADVINIAENTFETVSLKAVLEQGGSYYPLVDRLFSAYHEEHFYLKNVFSLDFKKDDLVFTAEGLRLETPYIKLIKRILDVLKEKSGICVDIEFASDGEGLFLLQCRSQNYHADAVPLPIPKDIEPQNILFTAKKYVTNGIIPPVTHVVYIDPEHYLQLSLKHMQEIGRAVGKLNTLLPKRKFILMGPGRWGSRGDIRLGVNASYSELKNTAMLIEIAHNNPDLSFGTHFFQDLVEAAIRYLPLYPQEEGTLFNHRFLDVSANLLAELLPEYKHLEKVIKVIDIPAVKEGKILKIAQNADLDEAIAYFDVISEQKDQSFFAEDHTRDTHWIWRLKMAESIAEHADAESFGIKGIYVFGSTKNANAAAGSDIDLLFHIDDQPQKRELLEIWLLGISQILAQVNYLKTGYKTKELLDVHFVTDTDIQNKTSYAVKIGAVSDAARPLKIW